METLSFATPERLIENKEHYTYQVKLLIDFYNQGLLPEIASITVEPRYGYVASIDYVDGGRRIIYGHDPGFNAGSAELLAKDKGYSKFMLRSLDINCPGGDEFLLPWWAETLRQADRNVDESVIQTTDEAHDYIEDTLQYPVYIKPVSGSQGSGVKKIFEESELDAAFAEYNEERVKVALVEESLQMPDYRLLMFDGELVNAYRREPFSVEGDGEQTVQGLIDAKLEKFVEQGRQIHYEENQLAIQSRLARFGLSLMDIPTPNQHVQLLDVSNLSAGGVPVDVMHEIHPHWEELVQRVAKGFNLRVCGVDLACEDITSPESEYSVLEVNATPGAKQFMASGEAGREKLEALFLNFFRTSKQ